MKRPILRLIIMAWLCCLSVVGFAQLEAPGKYSGVVIFDRWDGCLLYGGGFVMYVSEKTKAGLRPYNGQAVQIEAREIKQILNPGIGLIGKFDFLGRSTNGSGWIKLDGLQVANTISVNTNGQPVARLIISNTGTLPVKISSEDLAFTVLAKKETSKMPWIASDGPSYALITRQYLDNWADGDGKEGGTAYSWSIGKDNLLPPDFTLEAGAKRVLTIYFNLPDGEYDFLGGYGDDTGDTKCLAGNLSAFDIKNGKTIVR